MMQILALVPKIHLLSFLKNWYIFVLLYSQIKAEYHHEVLDRNNRFHFYWKIDRLNEKITFRIEVQTKGYVAVGLSPNGGMAGSDIAFGWVKNGKAHLQDRYAFKKGMPVLDDQQDWKLINGYENETHTMLQFSRKFDTCDHQDFPITNDTSRVIYAYHEDDPLSEDIVMYHGKGKRGSKSLILLQPNTRKNKLPNDVKVWFIRSPNVTIPDDTDTTYWCKIVKAPLLNKKHHVIQVEPLVSVGSSQYVHHMVLYRCLGATARELEPHVHHHGHPCYVPDMPQTYTKCQSVYAAWGVGGMAMVMPERAGLPLGDKPNLYFLLEIHYDNSEYHSGVVDESGFRVYYTPNLRRFDAMTLMVGASVDPCIVVPPGRRKFVIAGHADPQCLGPAINPEGIRIFAVFLHSHLLGRQMKLRHFRNNIELPFIAADQKYDFNYQIRMLTPQFSTRGAVGDFIQQRMATLLYLDTTFMNTAAAVQTLREWQGTLVGILYTEYRYLSNEVVVKPGDHLIVECTYDSTSRNSTTFGGLGTGQEMCLAFILYYPRIAIARSLSSATCDLVKSLAGMDTKAYVDDESSNYTFYQHFQKNNPWDSNYAGIAEAAMRYGYHTTQCFMSDGRKVTEPRLVTYPRNIRAYNEPSRCSFVPTSQGQWSDSIIYTSISAYNSFNLYTLLTCFILLLHKNYASTALIV